MKLRTLRIPLTVGALATAALTAALTACGGGTVTDAPGPGDIPTDTAQPPTGTVQRSSLTVNVAIAVEDQDVAAQAGLSVAGATVRVLRLAAGGAARTAVVGGSGSVKFDSLLEGSYSISVDRPLTGVELQRLAPEQRDASIFAGGTTINLRPPAAASGSVSMVAARRGSLVISELFAYAPGPPIFYGWGNYLEVFNNSDSTAYLDGVLMFMTARQMHTDIWGGCAASASMRMDTSHVWAQLIFAFPGSGHDYPIAPGTAKVVAMDAINHRAASPETDQVDLSHAEFEQIGSEADIDNPQAADMIRVRAGTGALGRGYPLGYVRSFGLARAIAASQLTTGLLAQQNGTNIAELYGIPSSAVLDVVSLTHTPAARAALDAIGSIERECLPWMSPRLENAVAPLQDSPLRRAMSRKSLGFASDGREILQRTRTSARDFDYFTPLRRSLDK